MRVWGEAARLLWALDLPARLIAERLTATVTPFGPAAPPLALPLMATGGEGR